MIKEIRAPQKKNVFLKIIISTRELEEIKNVMRKKGLTNLSQYVRTKLFYDELGSVKNELFRMNDELKQLSLSVSTGLEIQQEILYQLEWIGIHIIKEEQVDKK